MKPANPGRGEAVRRRRGRTGAAPVREKQEEEGKARGSSNQTRGRRSERCGEAVRRRNKFTSRRDGSTQNKATSPAAASVTNAAKPAGARVAADSSSVADAGASAAGPGDSEVGLRELRGPTALVPLWETGLGRRSERETRALARGPWSAWRQVPRPGQRAVVKVPMPVARWREEASPVEWRGVGRPVGLVLPEVERRREAVLPEVAWLEEERSLPEEVQRREARTWQAEVTWQPAVVRLPWSAEASWQPAEPTRRWSELPPIPEAPRQLWSVLRPRPVAVRRRQQ
ncbi:hypothetical protein GUJ93_ZPchr0014g47480 [Zizania palustris]|uniref:Uncharacterized protein n=1 Tax=Zizania palustris TaxID=103762 RepID=A0A8J5VV85_ZIZPA|nr:hypothetical protein GUJ93_ZPchr0014g47480 [Zizania palustris]